MGDVEGKDFLQNFSEVHGKMDKSEVVILM